MRQNQPRWSRFLLYLVYGTPATRRLDTPPARKSPCDTPPLPDPGPPRTHWSQYEYTEKCVRQYPESRSSSP
ncbi:hypothetical protein KQX54_004796 [Cotesia glomerata]|uniref:Secreted protein n=1 Tax=Cotesia glomerata TaxID=32391 RepID=A0AAV7I9J6_COTGL|nr:hypothetical protein KQX54_004796 [Cotesia glomerata]